MDPCALASTGPRALGYLGSCLVSLLCSKITEPSIWRHVFVRMSPILFIPDGPHEHGGADGERADSGRRAACPDCFPLIDDCGRGGHLKVRQSGHARRHCCGRGGHFEVRRPGHLSRRCTGPFEKENNVFVFFEGLVAPYQQTAPFSKIRGLRAWKSMCFFKGLSGRALCPFCVPK